MDGNGRWARQRGLPRVAGHRAGVEALRGIVEHSVRRQIEVLSVFAFSSENWRRPGREVSLLLELFMQSLREEAGRLHDNNVRLRFIGERDAFPPLLSAEIAAAETLTGRNTGLTLVVAANYGGRWDITQCARRLATELAAGGLKAEDIDENAIGARLTSGDLPEPDLFIRTGGERRISNFLLWQLAYTELYFTDCLWPDFSPTHYDLALEWYRTRERRFGRTGEQIGQARSA